MPSSNRSLNRAAFAAALIAGVFAVVEGMAAITGGVLAKRGVLYEPMGLADYPNYLAMRDPVLGWPAPGGRDRDETGARLAPDRGKPNCGEVYGDSFSFGGNVDATETFAYLLSERLGCRVANFAVGGYGSDQALMRYRMRRDSEARFVVLAHLTENIMRNVNQYRALLYPSALNGFKPRFVLDADGRLKTVPIPNIASERYDEFVREPEAFLDYEYFRPGGPSGLRTRGFPHSLALLGAFGHFHVRAELRDEIWYEGFYEPRHPSGGLQLTTAILREFERDAEARGQVAVPLILTTELDLAKRRDGSPWPQQPLWAALEREGVRFLDIGDGLLAKMKGRPAAEFFEGAHPTAEGHRLIAELLGEHLETIGLRVAPN